MEFIAGIGGVFLKCRDHVALKNWYERALGLKIENWGGAIFRFKDDRADGSSNLSFFKNDTKYLAPSESNFMLNLRVKNMEALLEHLKNEGIPLVGEPSFDDQFGKFAWVMDLEGNKVELWEQPAA